MAITITITTKTPHKKCLVFLSSCLVLTPYEYQGKQFGSPRFLPFLPPSLPSSPTILSVRPYMNMVLHSIGIVLYIMFNGNVTYTPYPHPLPLPPLPPVIPPKRESVHYPLNTLLLSSPISPLHSTPLLHSTTTFLSLYPLLYPSCTSSPSPSPSPSPPFNPAYEFYSFSSLVACVLCSFWHLPLCLLLSSRRPS